MKKIKLLTLLLFVSLMASAQADLFSTPYKWQIKKWSASFGQDWDMLGKVEHQYLLSTVRGETEMDYSNLQFPEEYISQMSCDNPQVRITANLPVPGRKNMDLNLSAMLVSNKIDMVEYEYSEAGIRQRLEFDSYTNELGIEALLLKKKSSFNRIFNFYGGLGTQLGASLGGTVNIEGENIQTTNDHELLNFSRYDDPFSQETITYDDFRDSYKMKAGFYQRIFGHLGFGVVILKRFEVGLEYRQGFGYRAIPGADLKGTQYRSFAINFGWILP